MTTGVDAQTCKLIVLDSNIGSMTEFKQIIGRGTRINEDYNKFFFTIMDFRRATALFADPTFDGDPVQIYEPSSDESPLPPDDHNADDIDPSDPTTDSDSNGETEDPEFSSDLGFKVGVPPVRYVVNNVPVRVAVERVQYLNQDGKLITESLTDYTRNAIFKKYASLEAFLNSWNDADRKQVILEELASQGVFFEELAAEVGRDFDPFDLVCHVAFDRPPLTRRERANGVKKRDLFGKYETKARAVLEALLEKYADAGILSLESMEILKVDPFRTFGTPIEIVNLFGGKSGYLKALRELESALYTKAA
jgi:type I restriction enzyme R subunit